MKKTLLLSVVVLLVWPAGAKAHNSHGWYWSESLAETRMFAKYDVLRCDCDGYGARIFKRGRALYKHFDCDTGSIVDAEWSVLHVRNKWRFTLT